MISRTQKVLFALLLLASVIMGSFLWRMREQAHRRMIAGQDSAPTKAPAVAAPEQATLMVANDDDNSLRAQGYSLPLAADPGARARALLDKLLDIYADPGSNHPVSGGTGSVEQVFLLPAVTDTAQPASDVTPTAAHSDSGPELAVVNLKASFAASHPSGLETETLTVLSICGTLHANLPRVTQVRFLVDGEVRPSLAGHADLTRTYLTSDAVPAELNQR